LKLQGLTLDAAIVDLSSNVFERAMAYVALSRVTSSQGLHLVGFDERVVFAHHESIKVALSLLKSDNLSYCRR